MSLLHQVLRDIDERRGLDAAQQQPATATQHSWPVTRYGSPWLLMPVLLMCGALIFQMWPQREQLPVAPLVVADLPESVTLSNTFAAGTTLPAENPMADDTVAVIPSAADDALSAAPAMHESPATEVSDSAPVTVTHTLNQEAAPMMAVTVMDEVRAEDVPDPAPALVIRRGAEARQWYQNALLAARNEYWREAGHAIEQALLLDSRDEYAALQLRIYLQQQETGNFIRYYRQESQRNTIGWLMVAAPGLHLLGFYDDAAGAYQRLLQQQNQPQWVLALAAALRDGGQLPQAQAVLQSLPLQRLSAEQQAWVKHILNEPQS